MRKLMWFTMGFGAACAFGAYLYGGSWLFPAGAVALFLAVGLWLLSQYVKPVRLAGMVCFGLAVGMLWFWMYDAVYVSRAVVKDGQSEFACIEVTDYSWDGSYGSSVDGVVTLHDRQYQVRAYLKEFRTYLPGDEIRGLFRFRITTDDGGEDATYHQGKGIFLLAYQAGEIAVKETPNLPLRYYPAYLRMRIGALVEDAFPGDTAAFARALFLGDSTDIDYATNTAFKVTGIRHIIAVSGLHVSILFSLIYTMMGKKRVLTAALGIPAVLLFAAVAGFTPSITRACIMQCLMMLALLWKREYDPPTALSFACLVMLLVNPLVSTSISFQLSVGCMVGIFLFSEKIRLWLLDKKRLGPAKGRGLKSRLIRWFASGVAVSLSAMTVTTPLVACYFSAVSLVSVVTNLLTLWVVTFIFYGIIAVCLLGSFWAAGAGALAWVIAYPIRYVLGVTALLAKLPLAAVYTYSDYILLWLIFAYVLFAVFLVMKRKQPVVFGCCVTLGLCIALLASWLEPLTDECRVTVLNVGQGQSILLQSQGKTFLVDCGGEYEDSAADTAAETLLSQGISRLDGLILTHYDADHAGGAEMLLTRIATDNLILPACPDKGETREALLYMQKAGVCHVTSITVFSFGSAKLTVIPPIQAETDNESSLCVLFQTENCDILITGDRDEKGEKELLASFDLPDLELLVVGHHGSKYATSEALLAATTPETAIISVGENNHYGHPAPETLERLEDAGCSIYRTDRDGTVIYRG